MTTISAFMTGDHRACDAQLADLESHVEASRWPQARTAWAAFGAAMRCHFRREEEILFLAFERATGGGGGPTYVMRMEHEQMRAAFGQLDVAVRAEDKKRVLALSESLMVLIQQHNMKEEQILYPMAEQLVEDGDRVVGEMQALRPESS
ncbi:MAG: hemerythrin domain-containing protein [Planctomycetes bacterium]|nr:hemerythrin domain-containing protein [Planctomycetota bacterium]